ncbi:hypothetical protein [Kitasatospora sp. NPDC050543]|uniref:hypothetical protein n=1 Tax=Kitasatospora sp. NPDC050543 TaxID=3364054 RepID=UPI00378D5FBD
MERAERAEQGGLVEGRPPGGQPPRGRHPRPRHLSADPFADLTVDPSPDGCGHRCAFRSGPSARAPRPREAAPLAGRRATRSESAALLLMAVTAAAYLPAGLLTRLRRSPGGPPPSGATRWLAGSGLTVVLGFLGYFGYVTLALTAGPVLAGRPVAWLALQVLTLGAVLAAAATAVWWWRARGPGAARERARLGAVLLAGAVVVPFALFWVLVLT